MVPLQPLYTWKQLVSIETLNMLVFRHTILSSFLKRIRASDRANNSFPKVLSPFNKFLSPHARMKACVIDNIGTRHFEHQDLLETSVIIKNSLIHCCNSNL